MTLTDHINAASRAGYKVTHDESEGTWWITTPKRPRVPSQELGSHKTEREAWMAAAFLSSQSP